jgi:transposase-like protein
MNTGRPSNYTWEFRLKLIKQWQAKEVTIDEIEKQKIPRQTFYSWIKHAKNRGLIPKQDLRANRYEANGHSKGNGNGNGNGHSKVVRKITGTTPKQPTYRAAVQQKRSHLNDLMNADPKDLSAIQHLQRELLRAQIVIGQKNLEVDKLKAKLYDRRLQDEVMVNDNFDPRIFEDQDLEK